MAALREAIQNAMDAVRLRQIVDPDAPEPLVEVDVVRSGDSTILKIRDNGVGMSESSIVGNLLSFGTSGWLADTAIGEYNDSFPLKSHVSGRYGIGFFSVFMLGSKVEIKSRRFDASPDQTTVLSFPEGLNTRPLLCGAEYMDRMTSGGTELFIHLDISKLEEGYWRSKNRNRFWAYTDGEVGELAETIAKHFPASSVPVKVRNGDQLTWIDGRNWDSEPASSFLQRIEGRTYPGETGAQFETAVSLITEETGETVGRAVLYPDRLAGRFVSEDNRVCGAVVAQGAKICAGSFRGMLLGKPLRAARDFATPLASPEAIQRWATEQARLLKPIVSDTEDQQNIAEQIASLGGDIGELKFCEVGGTYFDRDELRAFLKERDEIWVAQDAAVSVDRPKEKLSTRTDTCISVGCGLRSIVFMPIWARPWRDGRKGVNLRRIAVKIICEEFSIAEEVAEKMGMVEDGHSVYVAPAPVWHCDDNTTGFVDGQYFKRNMIVEDVDQFFIPRGQRG
nr:ATP-binding protein [Epibacterium sp. Ofav1-8]